MIVNNYSVSKVTVDGYYTYIFPEKLFEEYYGTEMGYYLSSPFAWYDFQKLEKKIFDLFGKPNKELKFDTFLIKANKIEVEEVAYFYDRCIVCIKTRINDEEDETPVISLSHSTKEEKKEPDVKKIKLKLDIFSVDKDEKRNEKFLQLFSKTNTEMRGDKELSILCFSQFDGFYLKHVKTIPINIELKDNYNDDFLDVSDYIVERLNTKNDKGIVLLYGPPGEGKTSYIRYLTSQIKEKEIIYIPPDFASNISNPDFITFFLSHSNSILIIEDAENILKSRKAGGNQSVANLLSISDGLLGDGLKLQIVCTFNSELNGIDEALLREGRLIAEYKFDKLSVEKSQALMTKLCMEQNTEVSEIPVITKPMTLAEIYNYKEKRFVTRKETTIGFNKK